MDVEPGFAEVALVSILILILTYCSITHHGYQQSVQSRQSQTRQIARIRNVWEPNELNETVAIADSDDTIPGW